MLIYDVANPERLFNDHATHMSEDIRYRINHNPSQRTHSSVDSFITSSLLVELDKLLRDAGYSLSHFNLPIPADIGTSSLENRLLVDELAYDFQSLEASIRNGIPLLNNNQNHVFQTIQNSVFNNMG